METTTCPKCEGEDLEVLSNHSICRDCNIGFTDDECWEDEVEYVRDTDANSDFDKEFEDAHPSVEKPGDIAHMNNLLYSQYDDDDPTRSDEEIHEARLKRAA